ncbi:MAG: oligoendopeptidase [Mycobacteriales bacterium]
MRTSESLRWNPALFAVDDDELAGSVAGVQAGCAAFTERYRCRLAALSGPELGRLLAELGELRSASLALDSLTALPLAADRAQARWRDRAGQVAGALDDVDEVLRLVAAEWAAAPASAVAAALGSPEVEPYRNFLTGIRDTAGFTLAEPVETALALREPAARDAWVDLYDRTMAALRPVVDGRSGTVEQARSGLESADPAVRAASLAALYEAVDSAAPVLAHCLDTLVADRVAVADLRGLPGPRAERDLGNELSPAVVDDLLAAAEAGYPLAHRWFRRKAELLGLPRLPAADLRAPISGLRPIRYDEAVGLVIGAFEHYLPDTAPVVRELFAGGYVDAEPRPGKYGGAFCRSRRPGEPPCILLSYFETFNDLTKLAHEVGHAVHFVLAGRRQTPLTFDACDALNEVPPALAELLVADWTIGQEPDPAVRTAMAARRLDTVIEAVFMPTFLTRFEEAGYGLRAAGGTLTDEGLRELWTEHSGPLYAPAVDLPARWGLHWPLVPHLVPEPFATYPYAFAWLIGLRLRRRLYRDGAGFAARFTDFLGRGGSAPPLEQLADLGVDPTDPGTWRAGLDEFAELVEPLLAAAPGAGRSQQ